MLESQIKEAWDMALDCLVSISEAAPSPSACHL